jgi:hypothetical protein
MERELYIEVAAGCDVPKTEYNDKDWVSRVLNNIYGQQHAGHM